MSESSASPVGWWQRFLRWLVRVTGGEPEASSTPDREPLRTEDVEDVERAGVAVSRQLRDEFERNLREPVIATRLRMEGVDLFPETTWRLNRTMNVLLGRNGYGKSLVLRTLAGMLQRDTEVTGVLFEGASTDARIEVELSRSGAAERLERDHEVFLRGSAGKVPLLAIPDSRFVDRGATEIAAVGTIDFTTDGALHFLAQEPYQAVVEALLAGLAFDYFENGRSFKTQSFQLINDVITELTEGQAFRFDEIERAGLAGARIKVRTEGLDRPLLIQQVSQGTLSMVTIFGLVHRFLLQCAEATGRDGTTDVLGQEAIVLIDEVDAHLHPAWQQRVRNLLTSTFPNVQFVLSAHSPLIVAGCGPGEVAVLGKAPVIEGRQGFSIDQLSVDFVGRSALEIYEEIFQVEDLDETFKEYVNKRESGQGARIEKEIDKLFAKQERKSLSEGEDRRLQTLILEQGRIDRVSKVQEQRRDTERRLAQRDAEIRRLRAELARIGYKPPEGER